MGSEPDTPCVLVIPMGSVTASLVMSDENEDGTNAEVGAEDGIYKSFGWKEDCI
jgi:hypothetical protein